MTVYENYLNLNLNLINFLKSDTYKLVYFLFFEL